MSQDTSNMTQETPGGERPEVHQASASAPVPPKKKAAARKKTAASASVTDTTAASDSEAVVVPQPRRRNGRVTFFTSRTSMFLDGYDLERERIEVLPLIQAAEEGQPIEAANPLFDRYMLYLDRAAEHERNSKVRQQRAQESGAVTRSEVKAYRALGGFSNADDEGDSVVIHTREAFQLFIGRAADPDNSKAARIISFKKVGAAYRLLWNIHRFMATRHQGDAALRQRRQRIEPLAGSVYRHRFEQAAQRGFNGGFPARFHVQRGRDCSQPRRSGR